MLHVRLACCQDVLAVAARMRMMRRFVHRLVLSQAAFALSQLEDDELEAVICEETPGRKRGRDTVNCGEASFHDDHNVILAKTEACLDKERNLIVPQAKRLVHSTGNLMNAAVTCTSEINDSCVLDAAHRKNGNPIFSSPSQAASLRPSPICFIDPPPH